MAAFDAPAKINLFLHVLAREHSGYHQTETLFCALDLADVLEVEAGEPGIALHVEGADIGPLDDNLVLRAARRFCERAGIAPALRMTLRKRIPTGAGLGGGSSDAAATLRALATMHPLAMMQPQHDRATDAGDRNSTRNEMFAIATEIGSDVPFFMSGGALALAWGRGERLLALSPLPRRPVLIVAPRQPIATADAYGALAARRTAARAPVAGRLLETARFADWTSVAQLAHNDFDEVAFNLVPGLERARDALRENGARIALLCGSGSALFGVFDSDALRDDAARRMRDTLSAHAYIATHTAQREHAVDPPGPQN